MGGGGSGGGSFRGSGLGWVRVDVNEELKFLGKSAKKSGWGEGREWGGGSGGGSGWWGSGWM